MASVGRELIQEIGITRNVFCSECGYNLRTRPRMGRCPECGNDYDANLQGRRGIFSPQDIHWPWDTLGFSLLSLALATLLMTFSVLVGETWMFVFGLIPSAFAVLFLSAAMRQGHRMYRYRALVKSVERQEADSDA